VSIEEYRQNAAACLHLADQTSDQNSKMTLTGMASAWMRLADQAAKNNANDITYEVPPGRERK
jgi:hypothetical protein